MQIAQISTEYKWPKRPKMKSVPIPNNADMPNRRSSQKLYNLGYDVVWLNR